MKSKIFCWLGVVVSSLLTLFSIFFLFAKNTYAEDNILSQDSFVNIGNHLGTQNIEIDGNNYLALYDTWCNSADGGTFEKRKQITLTNKSNSDVKEGSVVEVLIDTASMIANSELSSNGEDLRIFYMDEDGVCNELNVWWEIGSGATELSDSSLTSVFFKTSSDIPSGDKSPLYFIYYDNDSLVANTKKNIEVLSAGDSSTLFYANYNGNTKNIITEDSSLGSVINYVEEGTALHYNGIDAIGRVPNDTSLQISDKITIEAWVKRQDSSLGGLVFGKGTNYGLGFFQSLFF